MRLVSRQGDITGGDYTLAEASIDTKNVGHRTRKIRHKKVHHSNPHPLSFKDAAGAFALYVAIPSATLYPLGAKLLWLQLINGYDFGSIAAWHAVSQVSQTLTVAAGERVLLAPTLGLLLIPLILTFLLTFLYYREMEIGGRVWRIERTLFFRSLAVLLITLVLYFNAEVVLDWKLPVLDFLLPSRHPLDSGNQFLPSFTVCEALVFVATGGGALAGYLLAKDQHRSKQSSVQQGTPHRTWRWAARGALVAYIANIILALGSLGSQPLFLPDVEYSAEKEDASVRERGKLLGLSPGYWNILNQEGDIVAVPHAEAQQVTLPKGSN